MGSFCFKKKKNQSTKARRSAGAPSRLPASPDQALGWGVHPGCPKVLFPEDQEEAGTLAPFIAVTSTRHSPHSMSACGKEGGGGEGGRETGINILL